MRSSLPGRGYRKIWLVVLVLVPLGCSVKHLPILDLHSAWLITSTDRVPFEVATKEHLWIYDVNQLQRMVASYRGLSVTVGVLPGVQVVVIDEPNQHHEVTAVAGGAYYRLNDGDMIPLEVEAHRTGGEFFVFALPPPISTYEMVITGGTLVPASVKKIEARVDDVHRVYLPFLVDGEPFTIDVTFSVVIETRRVGAAPATP